MVAYFRPTTLTEALAIRSGNDVVVLAGGTDIYPAATARRAWGDPSHKDVLDISAIAGLDGILEMPDAFRLGCLVTWTDLVRAPLPALFDGLKTAARAVGGAQVQNRGTLVGNLCTASPAGDGIPNFLTLDASVEIASPSGVRTVAARDFIDGYRHNVCRGDEIVTAIVIPKLAHARSGFKKLGARAYLVISIAMVSGVIAEDADGRIVTARLAIGACSAVAERLPALEAALIGWPLGEAPALVAPSHVAQLSPIDDVRASATYRRAAALTLLRDLLAELAADRSRRAA